MRGMCASTKIDGMTLLYVVLAVVTILMVVETWVATQHEARMLASGGRIPPGDVFSLMSITYPLAFALMGWEGTDRLESTARGSDAWGPGAAWFLAGLAVFVAAKVLKYWAIRALGERWTYRIIVLPGAPLVHAGPYRYVSHPNYIAIIVELAGTAMMLGAPISGPVTTVLFGLILLVRIRFENRVVGIT
jgi:methyltransferase